MIPQDLLDDPQFPDIVAAINRAGLRSKTFGGDEGPYQIQQNPRELAALVTLARRLGPPRHYLEIGCATAGTTRILHELLGFERVAVIDLGRFRKQAEANLAHVPYTACWANSATPEAYEYLRGMGAPFDLVLIDGNHHYNMVAADYALAAEFSHPQTLIALHDIRAMPRFASIEDDPDVDPCDTDESFCGGPALFWRRAADFERVATIIDESLKFMGYYSCGLGVARRKD